MHAALYAVFMLDHDEAATSRQVALGTTVGVCNVIVWCSISLIPIIQVREFTPCNPAPTTLYQM